VHAHRHEHARIAAESDVEALLLLSGARNPRQRPWSRIDRWRDDAVMNTRDITLAYHAIIEAISAGDLDRLDQLVAADLVDHNSAPGRPPGLVGFKHWANSAGHAFPDLTGSVATPGPTTTRLPDE